MKKYKVTLISMIVFMTVFILVIIIDIPLPIHKNNSSRSVHEADTGADTLAVVTEEAPIESFSYEVTSAPESDTLTVDTVSAGNIATPTAAAAITQAAPTPSPQPTATPAPKPSKYADVGISVAKDYVNIRKKPSTDSSVLGKLYKGSACEIIKTKGDWYYVESGSVKGYILSEFIKTKIPDDVLIKKFGTLSISVECDGLNVRKTPSTDSKRVTVVYKDEIYPVVKSKGKWLKIKVSDDNVSGYVKREFTDVIVKFKEAVSKEEEALIKQLEAENKAKRETAIRHRENTAYDYTKLQLLSCLIHAEAGTQSYETKLAVANVVLNRMKSGHYPSSMKSVIYQSGQFTVAASGSLQKQLNSYKSYHSESQLLSVKAAKDALAGANNIGSRMHFNSYGAAVRKGYDDYSTSVKLEGLLFW